MTYFDDHPPRACLTRWEYLQRMFSHERLLSHWGPEKAFRVYPRTPERPAPGWWAGLDPEREDA